MIQGTRKLCSLSGATRRANDKEMILLRDFSGSFQNFMVDLAESTGTDYRNTLTWINCTPYFERQYTWNLYTEYTLIHPNLLWSFKNSWTVSLRGLVWEVRYVIVWGIMCSLWRQLFIDDFRTHRGPKVTNRVAMQRLSLLYVYFIHLYFM